MLKSHHVGCYFASSGRLTWFQKTCTLSVSSLRQSARNFTASELEKELVVYHSLKPLMGEINTAIEALSLSLNNQQHLTERVDYYGKKLKLLAQPKQTLYLLCYAQWRYQFALERIADDCVYHVRQTKQKATVFAQKSVYRDWQQAAIAVAKASEVLRLFTDEKIDQLKKMSEKFLPFQTPIVSSFPHVL